MSAPTTTAPQETTRQFITREFADTLAGKTPAPYLRTHDRVQRGLAESLAVVDDRPPQWRTYVESAIHLWREVSLSGLKRTGQGADECHALVFESAFDLALSQPDWAADALGDLQFRDEALRALHQLAHQAEARIRTHAGLVGSLAAIQAPAREEEADWNDEYFIACFGEIWFWAALLCANLVDENHRLSWFRRDLIEMSRKGWKDNRLHTRLIREAPLLSPSAPRAELLAHPLIRIARLKYKEGGIEQQAVRDCLNDLCISARFESEEDTIADDLTLATWVRDARKWAARLRRDEPQRYADLIDELGPQEVDRVRRAIHEIFGDRPARLDALDATRALVSWANRLRGHGVSRNRGERWEVIVEVVDAALWLDWVLAAPENQKP